MRPGRWGDQGRSSWPGPARVIVSEADGQGSAVGGHRAVHETVRVQVCQSIILLLNVQIDEFLPGVVVVQLGPQIRGATQDGCQLPELPFLWGEENRVDTLKNPHLAGEVFSLLQG